MRDRHVGYLDGIRGAAALWVFLCHASILVGGPSLFSRTGGTAVDVFMTMSGFLMLHHYLFQEERAPWTAPATWRRFWSRRFFRIAPLYYVALVPAYALAPWLGALRASVLSVVPGAATDTGRYSWSHLGENLVWHVSLLFGLSPTYSFANPLPDWSIGLEWQFYLAFPLLALAVRRHAAVGGVALLIAGVALARTPFAHAFPMPAFLPLKLHYFVIGMVWALYRYGRIGLPVASGLTLASLVAALLVDAHLKEVALSLPPVLTVIALIVTEVRRLATLDRLRALLSGPVAQWLADASYSLYLLHLLLLIPIAALLLKAGWFVGLPGVVRFGVAAVVALPLVLGLSALTVRWIERPGIALGKRLA